PVGARVGSGFYGSAKIGGPGGHESSTRCHLCLGMKMGTLSRAFVTAEHPPPTSCASAEEAIARGSYREALALCARLHGPAVGRLCMALIGSQAEADELVQETLLLAHDSFASYRAEGPLR